MERDWERAVFSMAACRGQGGWVPEDVRAGNVLPVYQWFDGTSLANVLGQAPVQKPGGEYVLALPNGSVQSTGARLYPMKPHRSNSARLDSTGELIPHSTYTYFTSGNFAAAVAEGQRQSGLTGPYTVVPVQEYQTINHGVESKSSALQCGACHAQYSSGGPVRMNLQKDLGYGLKATSTPLCSQCHSAKTSPGFAYMHNKHVVDKGYDCSACHEFSRPERQLGTGRAIRPAAPNGPVATALSATSTRLVWADNSSSEQGFRIERSTDGASFIEVGTVAANITSASDSGLTPGKAYFYRVRAYNASGTSAYSQVGRATPGAVPISSPPPAPEGLSATAGQQSVALTWNRVGEASAYIVKRSTTIGGSFSAIASGVTTSAFTDTGLNGGTTYYYVVSAVNSSGEGPDSAAVSATPVAPPPSAPTQVAARGFDRAGIQVSWVPSISPNIVENRIYRSASSTGVFSLVGRVSGAVPTYSDTGLKRGAIYYYRVTAVNSSGRESAPSATVSARAGRTR
jgi:fibronectin type 3 domain-containing protein